MKNRVATRGVFKENPVFVMLLGLCPALAVTTTVINAWTMGASVLFVLLASSLALSLLRKNIPESASPYAELIVIAVFVAVVEPLLTYFAPAVRTDLGIYVPLIAVNCVILNQAKGSARGKTPGEASIDALSVGVGFLLSLSLIALIREVLGFGTITLIPLGRFSGVIRIPGLSRSPARVMVLSVGAFLVLGYLMALINVVRSYENRRRMMRDSAQPTTMEGTTGGQQS
jgi:electron transport complex protein RnfE